MVKFSNFFQQLKVGTVFQASCVTNDLLVDVFKILRFHQIAAKGLIENFSIGSVGMKKNTR